MLGQDIDDLEIIVADDHSGDDTEAVMQEMAAKDARITYFRHQRNLGMVENWNWGLSRAKGTYVMCLMADDKLNHPGALRRMATALDTTSGSALAASARSIIDASSIERDVFQPLGNRDRVFPSEWLFKYYLNRDPEDINPVGEPSAVLMRRAFTQRGFDPAFRQLVDMEMWCHLLQQGSLVYLAQPLCCFRRHEQQQTKVNQLLYLHEQEELELCRRYSHPAALKRVLFHKMVRIAKLKQPELAKTLAAIRLTYSPLEYLRHYLQYKATRPFVNIARSIQKRRQRRSFTSNRS